MLIRPNAHYILHAFIYFDNARKSVNAIFAVLLCIFDKSPLLFFLLSEAPFVFSNRDEAFKVLRKFRESRLKCFKTYGEAEFFANYGLETSTSNDVNATKNDSDTQSNNNSCDAAPKGEETLLSHFSTVDF